MYNEIISENTFTKKNKTDLPGTGICFIIPAHYFERKIKDGSPEQRDRAIYTLKISQLIRGQRMALSGVQTLALSAHANIRREIYDMQNSQTQTELPGNPVRQEGGSDIADKDVDNVYNNTGTVYKFYNEVFKRNSLNNHGMTLVSSVHFARDYDNAYWNGRQMVYGDGDDVDFKKHKLAELLDVTGHEMTHGVTNYTSNLDYVGESGGLNESMSDCFGIMISQWASNQTVDAAHWLIGEGLMVEGEALRSMKDPGKANPDDDQIKNYHDYQDDMDVHTSSGIGNYAFYLACKAVGGHSWEKIGKVWYITNTARLRHNSGFQDAANHTFDVAGSLFGEGSKEQKSVSDAWKQAGLDAKKPDLLANVSPRIIRR
jgi:Zn-dependent metalloprotease